MTWDYLKRIRDMTKMKMVLKGILAYEDAMLAVEAGIDGIIVSNHGARSEDSGRSTIDALPEIIEAVKGRMPVLVDSGFRRGTDIVKALCMGARRVRRPALRLGARRLRPAGRRARARAAAHRVARDDAAGRRADDQAPHAGDGAAGLSCKLTTVLILHLRMRTGSRYLTFRSDYASACNRHRCPALVQRQLQQQRRARPRSPPSPTSR